MLVFRANLAPKGPGRLELVGQQEGNDRVDLHYLLLFEGQQGVLLELVLDALGKVLPVQFTDEVLKLSLVQVIATLHGRHISLNEVVLGHVARQDK